MNILGIAWGTVPHSSRPHQVGGRHGAALATSETHCCHGFTLVELMVAIAILAILLGLAVPSIRDIMRGNRAMSLSNELVGSLSYARAEAVKRAANVTVCTTADASVANPICATTSGWTAGWLVFVDDGTPGVVDGTDLRLQVAQPDSGDASIIGDAAFASYAQFNSRGAAGNGAGGNFTLCIGGLQRIVAVGATGRIKLTRGTC